MPIWAWKKNARAPHPRSAFMVAPNVALLLLEAAHGDERVVTFENIYIWHTVCSYATIDQRAFSEPDRDHDRIGGSKRGRNAERHVCSDSAWAAKRSTVTLGSRTARVPMAIGRKEDWERIRSEDRVTTSLRMSHIMKPH